jgi:beta-glucanase (GH16 family)
MACAAQASASVTNPTIGALLWSEEFNGTAVNTTVWTPYNGDGCQIGLCGYGNAELESYSPNNLSVVSVPFEPSTRALAIQARREVAGSSQFTSGKLDSYGKVQVQYGMIEVRMAAPNVQTGLWPAAWLLGTTAQAWPRKGEIDMMEQGHKQASWSAAGAASPNNFVGSNVITYQTAACVPGNESCAASTSWQTKSYYVAPSSLANRFVTYRLYWTDTQMRFTIVDNGVEHDMYNAPLPVNSTALQAPFYLLLNLAVGGNFTDAASPAQVTAPLPGTMYVDYVRVYQLDGKGTVKLGNQIVPETGKFGVFTDNTAVTHKLVAGTSSDIYLWNSASMAAGNTAPYEGSNVIAWAYTAPGQWFGGGIQSRDIKDMSNFRAKGTMSFRIKIPANVAFKVGVGDTYTNQNWISFPANAPTYGLVRNGDWAQATIPVSVLAGPNIALQSLHDIFMIANDSAAPGTTFQFAIDDIVWDSGTTTTTPPPPPPPPTGPTSITQTSATTLTFNTTTGSWADVHYKVNNGGQQNVRMTLSGTNNSYVVSGLKANDVVSYSFTYWDTAHNYAVDTAVASYTMK